MNPIAQPQISNPQPPTPDPACYVVSDLHLFSQRTLGHEHEAALHATAAQADHFVLAGDIFDFHWSTLSSIQDTVRAADLWLGELVQRYPGCRFHYLLGNHDNHRLFVDRLDALATQQPNFAWQPYLLRMGSSVFLHGDAGSPGMTPDRLPRYRKRWSKARQRTPMQNRVYAAVTKANLHKAAIRMAAPRRTVARRLLTYLDSMGHGPESGIADVYFGHTHRAMSDFPFQGVRFHNGGAPMPGLKFQILKARL